MFGISPWIDINTTGKEEKGALHRDHSTVPMEEEIKVKKVLTQDSSHLIHNE